MIPAATTPATVDAPTRARYRARRRGAFLLTWLAYGAYYLCRKNLAVVKDALGRPPYRLSNTRLGALDTAYLTSYAIGQFPSGLLGDRAGPRRMLAGGLALTALLNAGFGSAGTAAAFLALWGLNGLAQSTGWSNACKVFSHWFARHERGTVMGTFGTSYAVGGVVATLLATWVSGGSWRLAFLVPAAIVGGYAILFYVRFRDDPRDLGLPPVERYYAALTGRPEEAGDGHAAGSRRRTRDDLRHVLGSLPIWTLGVTYMALKFTRYALLFWLPLYMRQALGFSHNQAGVTSVAFEVAGVAGPIVAGLVSDRLFQARRMPVVVIMMALLALAAHGYATAAPRSPVANAIGIGLMGLFLYGPDSVISGVAAVDFGGGAAAAASGFVNALGSTGAALSGLLVGWISDTRGWDAVFGIFAPVALAGALLLLPFWNRTPARRGGG